MKTFCEQFKGVSKFFAEVFSELVPGGRASLVMLKSGETNGDAARSVAGSKIQYTGVAMKVTFTTTGEAYLLQQLSGGQKSIVALALIFAIQRLDPAPFYLFDEIDANLDATYRQAVANVIKKQAGGTAQFITTTFRPEFVHAGDKWFGVTHRNKVSAVQEVTRDVALTFINKDEAVR
jgi:structural maintenance of chromosome 3 (chondroitin sulfate proteoglycan 6)